MHSVFLFPTLLTILGYFQSYWGSSRKTELCCIHIENGLFKNSSEMWGRLRKSNSNVLQAYQASKPHGGRRVEMERARLPGWWENLGLPALDALGQQRATVEKAGKIKQSFTVLLPSLVLLIPFHFLGCSLGCCTSLLSAFHTGRWAKRAQTEVNGKGPVLCIWLRETCFRASQLFPDSKKAAKEKEGHTRKSCGLTSAVQKWHSMAGDSNQKSFFFCQILISPPPPLNISHSFLCESDGKNCSISSSFLILYFWSPSHSTRRKLLKAWALGVQLCPPCPGWQVEVMAQMRSH